jgi:hypothetical protein
VDEDWFSFPKEKFDDSYSEWLEHNLGEACARTFASGCDIIRDQIADDLRGLGVARKFRTVGLFLLCRFCESL